MCGKGKFESQTRLQFSKDAFYIIMIVNYLFSLKLWYREATIVIIISITILSISLCSQAGNSNLSFPEDMDPLRILVLSGLARTAPPVQWDESIVPQTPSSFQNSGPP